MLPSAPPPAAAARFFARVPDTTLTGTRVVAVTGRVGRDPPAPGTYGVTETDRGVGRRLRVFMAPSPVPTRGIETGTESIESVLTLQPDGPAVVSSAMRFTGIDRGAHQTYEVDASGSSTSVFSGPVAAVEHVVEQVRTPYVGPYSRIDMTRTTNADGSFDETGSVATMNLHELHVGRDFAVRAHDEMPGFSLFDVDAAPPSGSGRDATIAVTVAHRGREIGDVPIERSQYTVPLWFPIATPPVSVQRVANRNAVLPRECAFPADVRAAFGVRAVRRRIDPSSSITETVSETFYAASFAALCRIERTSVDYYDVTSGARTGSVLDVTVASATPTSRPRGTR
jgi:hypothetical protein